MLQTHCRGNPKFNFHKYMIRALEDDFKKVVGISWYLWVFVVLFLLLNINGWHTYFWLAFIPFAVIPQEVVQAFYSSCKSGNFECAEKEVNNVIAEGYFSDDFSVV